MKYKGLTNSDQIQGDLKPPNKVKIFVIGDLMLDHYVLGSVNRISPEAPVAVLDVEKEYYTLGGAGNVIQNLASLGVDVECCGVIGGQDNIGLNISQLLENLKVKQHLLIDSDRQTTRKTRFVTSEGGTQLLRVDREDIIPFDIDPSKIKIPNDVDMIIVSDYAKGMITKVIMDYLRSTNKKIIVDPKPEHGNLYSGVFMITPNRKEYSQLIPFPITEYVLKTLGKDGLDVINVKKNEILHIPGKEVAVYNVSGCGDTVVAVIATCLSMGVDMILSAKIANHCAGIVATKPGTTPIQYNEFLQALDFYLENPDAEVLSQIPDSV